MVNLAKPSEAQLRWQDAEFGMFLHFSINTYANKEWSDGSYPPSIYNPTELDCDQWVTVAKNAGIKYMMLVCKHHDGFCNWQTKTTDYSVKSSPWKNGQGDTVAEFVAACRKQNMRFGFYLSPWDRHEPKYQDKVAYDEFYSQQLEELLTQYAKQDEVFELWFDGAGSNGREYNWPKIMAICQKYQPNAMIFNMGNLTIRWAGNEHGFAPYPLWNAVQSKKKEEFNFGKNSTDGEGDLWIPAECDVPIRIRHWFHHKGIWGIIYRKSLLSEKRLLEIYEKSIGRGANLLLNLAPNEKGKLDEVDIKRLKDFVKEVQRRYGTPLAETSGTGMNLELNLNSPQKIRAIITQEAVKEGQRIRRYHIEAKINGTWTKIMPEDETLTIGQKKIDKFPTAIQTDGIKIVVEDCFAEPIFRSLRAYYF